MSMLIFKSPRGKIVEFDDYDITDEYEDGKYYWAEMCKSCHNKYRNISRGHFDDP